MNEETRKKAVVCMEFLVRSVNNEDLLDAWLMNGVADGDIPRHSLDTENVDEYFIRDENFSELMALFLRIMLRAKKDGGLYIDGIVSAETKPYTLI